MATPKGAVLKSEEDEICPECEETVPELEKLSCEHGICSRCLEKALPCPVCKNTASTHVIGETQMSNYPQEVEPDSPIEADSEESRFPFCSLHKSQHLALYCETCKKNVCRDCALAKCAPDKHNYDYFEKLAQKYKDKLDKDIFPIRQLQQDISEALVTIAEDNKRLEKLKREEEEQLEGAFETFIMQLTKAKSRVLSNIEKRFTGQICNNTSKSTELATSLDEINTYIKLTDSTTLEECSATTLMKIAAQKNRLQELQHGVSSLSLVPVPFPDLDVGLQLIPESFDTKKFLFHTGKGYRCLYSEHKKLRSLKLKQAFTIDFHLTTGSREAQIKSVFTCLSHNSSVNVAVTQTQPNVMKLSFTPQQRGRHELHINLNNTAICGSPISSFVHIDLTQLLPSSGKLKQTMVSNASAVKCYDEYVYVSSAGSEVVVLEHKKQGLAVAKKITLPGVDEFLIWEQHIYYTNTRNHQVSKTTMEGQLLASVGGAGSERGHFGGPNGIRISRKGELYISDNLNHRIQVLDTDLNWLAEIGKMGTDPGQFQNPYDLVFDEEGNFYVVECKNSRIQVFTPEGEHIRFIGASGDNRLLHPVSASLHNRHLYVTDVERRCVAVFTLTGKFVTSFGERDSLIPECVDVDRDGYIYVTSHRKHVMKY